MTEWHETEPTSATRATGDDLEVIVVGGGQAGLAVGYFLARQGRDFAILEAGEEPALAWRARRDSLKLFTPARYSGLPRAADFFNGRRAASLLCFREPRSSSWLECVRLASVSSRQPAD